jgi:hypothetical protein
MYFAHRNDIFNDAKSVYLVSTPRESACMTGKTAPSVQYCSVNSSQTSEPLMASAPRTDFWVLLEYPYPVSEKALKKNLLADEVNSYLAALQAALPASRVLLTHKQTSKAGLPLSLFLADGREAHAALYEILLNNSMDLLGLDIPAIFTGGAQAHTAIARDTLFLVCTNGKRDACCAKWGLPLYNSLIKHYGDLVWQTSHVGGHRFAPNLICLPHGIYNGRIPLEKASLIADRYMDGRLTLEYYRGLATYPAPVQAAEHHLRLMTGDDRIEAYHLETFSPRGEDRWEISFSGAQDQTRYQIYIESIQTGAEIYESCNTPAERKAVKEFRLLEPIQVG